MNSIVFYFGRNEHYELKFNDTSKSFIVKGDDLLDTLDKKYRNQSYISLIKAELKSLHVALSRAIEEGDQLKIGIVLGQTVSKLEELINQ